MNKHANAGIARAAALSPDRRSEIAREAAVARWRGHKPESSSPSPDALPMLDDAMIERAMTAFAPSWSKWPDLERVALRLGMTKALGAALSGGMPSEHP